MLLLVITAKGYRRTILAAVGGLQFFNGRLQLVRRTGIAKSGQPALGAREKKRRHVNANPVQTSSNAPAEASRR
jgi:hypothetical protein